MSRDNKVTGKITIIFERHVSNNDPQRAAKEAVRMMARELGYRSITATDIKVHYHDYYDIPPFGEPKILAIPTVSVML